MSLTCSDACNIYQVAQQHIQQNDCNCTTQCQPPQGQLNTTCNYDKTKKSLTCSTLVSSKAGANNFEFHGSYTDSSGESKDIYPNIIYADPTYVGNKHPVYRAFFTITSESVDEEEYKDSILACVCADQLVTDEKTGKQVYKGKLYSSKDNNTWVPVSGFDPQTNEFVNTAPCYIINPRNLNPV